MEPVQHGRVAVVKVGAGAQADLCYLVVLAVLLSITQCVLVLQKVPSILLVESGYYRFHI